MANDFIDVEDEAIKYGSLISDDELEEEVKRVSRGDLRVYKSLPAGRIRGEQPELAEDQRGDAGSFTP